MDDIPKRQWRSHKILAFHTKGCMPPLIAFYRPTFVPEPTQMSGQRSLIKNTWSWQPGKLWIHWDNNDCKEKAIWKVWVKGRSLELPAFLAKECFACQAMHVYSKLEALYLLFLQTRQFTLSAPRWQVKPICNVTVQFHTVNCETKTGWKTTLSKYPLQNMESRWAPSQLLEAVPSNSLYFDLLWIPIIIVVVGIVQM